MHFISEKLKDFFERKSENLFIKYVNEHIDQDINTINTATIFNAKEFLSKEPLEITVWNYTNTYLNNLDLIDSISQEDLYKLITNVLIIHKHLLNLSLSKETCMHVYKYCIKNFIRIKALEENQRISNRIINNKFKDYFD